MEFTIHEGPVVIVSHKGENLHFDVSAYDRKTIVDTPNLFKEINDFISKKSLEVQDNIFDSYITMKNTIDEIYDATFLSDKLRAEVTKMYNIIHYDDVLEYTKYCVELGESNQNNKTAILIPPNPQLELSDTDRSELTYLKHQTIELLAYAIYLRFMLPVWGMYMSAISSQIGNRYKEYYSFMLLKNTDATEVDAFEKLRQYAGFLLEPDLNKHIAVYEGFGSNDIIDYVVTQAIVRRVSLNVISTNQLSSFIVSYIYNFIRTVPKSINRVVGGAVKDNKSTFKDDNNDSVLDLLRARDNIAQGEVKLQETGLIDCCKTARKIFPDSNDDITKAFERAMDNNSNFTREDFQFSLTMMLLNSQINGPVLDYVKFDEFYRKAVVIAQSVIYQMGYPIIAALMTAVKLEGNPPLLNGSITRLTKEINLQLLEKFSHYRYDIKDEYDKKSNKGVVNEIENMVDEFVGGVWEPHVPDIEPYRSNMSSIITIPTDIRVQLANLIYDAN